MIKIKKALISVSDKSNILELAKSLSSFDIEILSTGGTAKLLKENKINVLRLAITQNFQKCLMEELKHFIRKFMAGF